MTETADPIEPIILRTGREVPRILVSTTTMALDALLADPTGAVACIELLERARDPEHEMFGNTGETLTWYGLLHGGQIHDAIRDIVLASFKGESFAAVRVSPF